ncbi:putative short-chain oxidoreductase [Mollisia scopiformis]|uniref:Putative short-chain oxidoreductase n=1 Tax=Mollisia scopiformis TaxID=149040 RepID=A0A194X2N5_MOLSC|nr:putative short-chain oxidoreductase [Mollisia scopiformis]KUJ14445.1 putative short-chain oxidoreductase [Mollisia scopiformis]
MSQSHPEPLVWLITGTSTGFGHLFALTALARGDHVLATSRRATTRPELISLREKGAHLIDLDVTASKTEIEKVVNEALKVYGRVDVLVNNAGYVEMSIVEELEEEKLMNQLQTNFFGAQRITQALLPHFRTRRTGKIAFIGSIFGLYAMPMTFPYSASKFLLAAYNEALNAEMGQFGVKSILFDIGHFRTGVVGHAKFSVSGEEDYAGLMGVLAESSQKMNGAQPGDPEKGVKVMVDVIREEGKAKGRKWPLRVPVGGDAVEVARGRGREIVGAVEEWEGVVGGAETDFEGVINQK